MVENGQNEEANNKGHLRFIVLLSNREHFRRSDMGGTLVAVDVDAGGAVKADMLVDVRLQIDPWLRGHVRNDLPLFIGQGIRGTPFRSLAKPPQTACRFERRGACGVIIDR